MTKSKKNYNSIDFFKIIMAFAVVAIHTKPLEGIGGWIEHRVFNAWVTMAVPFFFMASGYLLASKMKWTFADGDAQIIKRHLLKILKMYLVWMLIYSPLAIIHYISLQISPIEAALRFIRGVFFTGQQYNSWQLWYLLSTIYSLVLILLFMRKFRKTEYLLILSGIASVISVGITAFVECNNYNASWMVIVSKVINFSISDGRLFSGLVYIPIGMCIFGKRIPILLNLGMLAAAFVLHVFFVEGVLAGYLTIISSIGLFGLVERITLKESACYARLRSASTIIYLMHMYIWTIYYMAVYGEKTYGIDCFIATLGIAIFVMAVYLWLREIKGRC